MVPRRGGAALGRGSFRNHGQDAQATFGAPRIPGGEVRRPRPPLSAVEPVALVLLSVDAGLFAPLLEPKILVDAGAVALKGADKGFAADVAGEAVDLAGLRGGDDFERQTWARFGFSSCVT